MPAWLFAPLAPSFVPSLFGLARISHTREAVASVMSVDKLRYIAFSHVEADECGSLNEWLAAAPQSVPLCGTVAAMVSIEDLADRVPRALADDELLRLGKHSVRWFDALHTPVSA